MAALQKINLGAVPSGAGGDSYRGGNAKNNANVDVLNKQITLTSGPTVSKSQAIDAVTYIGKRVKLAFVTAGVLTLMTCAEAGPDGALLLYNTGPAVVTLVTAGNSGDTIFPAGQTWTLGPWEAVTLISDGVNGWFAVSSVDRSLMPINIGPNADLNSFVQPGIYAQPSNNNATNGGNYPAPLSGVLEVFANNAQMVFHRYTVYNSGSADQNKTYTRGMVNGSWSPWRSALLVDAGNTINGAIVANTATINGALTGKAGATFAGTVAVGGAVIGTGSSGAVAATNGAGAGQTSMFLVRAGAPTDKKTWEQMHDGNGALVIRTVNDNYTGAVAALQITRGVNTTDVSTMSLMPSMGNVMIGTTAPPAGPSTLNVGNSMLLYGSMSDSIGLFSASSYSGGLTIEAATGDNKTKKNIALAPWGGRVLIGNGVSDDGTSALRVQGQAAITGNAIVGGNLTAGTNIVGTTQYRYGLEGDGSAVTLYNDAGKRNFVVRSGPSTAYKFTQITEVGDLLSPGGGYFAALVRTPQLLAEGPADLANASLILSNTGTNGRKYSVASRGTSDFAISDENAGATRLSINSAGTVTVSNALTVKGVFNPGQFKLAGLPSAALSQYGVIIVTDATGGPKLAVSDGTNWNLMNTSTKVS